MIVVALVLLEAVRRPAAERLSRGRARPGRGKYAGRLRAGVPRSRGKKFMLARIAAGQSGMTARHSLAWRSLYRVTISLSFAPDCQRRVLHSSP
jgi:hypothetical protein